MLADLGNIGPNFIKVILNALTSLFLLLERASNLGEALLGIVHRLTVSAVANSVGRLSTGKLFNINGGLNFSG
jgi:hypothetical protein